MESPGVWVTGSGVRTVWRGPGPGVGAVPAPPSGGAGRCPAPRGDGPPGETPA